MANRYDLERWESLLDDSKVLLSDIDNALTKSHSSEDEAHLRIERSQVSSRIEREKAEVYRLTRQLRVSDIISNGGLSISMDDNESSSTPDKGKEELINPPQKDKINEQ